MSARWEDERPDFDTALTDSEHVPENAAAIAISLGGPMAPIRETQNPEKRKKAAANGQLTRGPAGYGEIGCGTLSFYSRFGDILRTVRIGGMPETKKAALS